MKTYKAPTLFQLWFWLITRFVGWLFVGCIGCIAVSIVIVALQGGQTGLAALQALALADYQYLISVAQPHAVSMVTGWLQSIPSVWSVPHASLPMISQDDQQRFWMSLAPFINAALLGVKLLIIRLYLLLCWCPLFLLFGVVGLIDGLAQRHIRRASAGRESALIYHNAKPLIMLSLVLGIFIDLILPLSIKHAEWIIVVAAILLGLAIQVSAKSFKKYV